MILSLDIRGLGVIDEAHLDFGPGLTVLTGETGAGKTMVLTSLQMLLGRRADPAWVRQGARQAEVDGVFHADTALESRVDDIGGIVEDNEVIISRVIAAHGRSRAHLGGRAVPASMLSEVTSTLVTIHGQADQMALRSPAAQRQTLDDCGDDEHRARIDAYQYAWMSAVQAKKRLDAARDSGDERTARILLLEELTNRIAELDPQAGEDELLRAEAERLTNVEELRRHLGYAHAVLSGGEADGGVLDLIRAAVKELDEATRLDPALAAIADRLRPVAFDVEAHIDDLSAYLAQLNDDPARLAYIHERRAALRALMHGRASDVDELIVWQEKALSELAELTAAATDPQILADELAAAQQQVLTAGEALRHSRLRLADWLSEAVNKELHALSMPDAHFSIHLEPTKPMPHGMEDVQMLLQPHPSAPARPLGQGASGGELSRVMLAIEVALGTHSGSATYIFDEVDAGIGGRTASAVGQRLAQLAHNQQVVVVTHLPQVAAYATTHLLVEKNDGLTTVRPLDAQARVDEIARMMGAERDSEAAREHAAELLRKSV